MKKAYKVYQIDSFSDKKFLGNPAGVVYNADGLNEVDMQRIARELNNSETAFFFHLIQKNMMPCKIFYSFERSSYLWTATIAAHYVIALENI